MSSILGELVLGEAILGEHVVVSANNVEANAGLASGTGRAYGPYDAYPGTASGIGTAYGITPEPLYALPGVASGTGTAYSPGKTVAPTAGVASGTGTAYQPLVSVGGATAASAELASGTGTAYQPTHSIAPTAGVATGTGTAYGPAVRASAGVAAGSGAAYNPTISTVSGAFATGAAYNASCIADSNPASLIFYDESENITDYVDLLSAKFVSMANGQPGTAYVKVLDRPNNKSFTVGKPLTLWIGGVRKWTGFVSQVERAYGFEARETTNVERYLILHGVDINLLFQKRFVFNQSTPARVEGFTYSAVTNDSTAIAELVTNWLDLSGDGLDLSSMVETVGTVNIDQNWYGWQAGMTWAQAMRVIAASPAAVFYIDPYKRLVYTDVDTPNSPYAFSDTPTGGQVGYQKFELFFDGSNLVNDVLAWGVSGADPDPIFDRLEDAASIAEHGRWQYARTYAGVYKQATLNKITDSIVYGSPQSKRGRKDDRKQVSLTTYQPGFGVAQKATVISNVFGYSDVLPIRRMEVTFPNPNEARYSLALSHDIDQALEGLIDVIPLPGLGDINDPIIPGLDIPIPCNPDLSTYYFDSFDDRTETSIWGQASSGADWDTEAPAGTTASVHDGVGEMVSDNVNTLYNQTDLPFDPGSEFEMLAKWSIDYVPVLGSGEALTLLEFGFWDDPIPFGDLRFNIGIAISNTSINGGGYGRVYLNDDVGQDEDTTFSFSAGTYFTRIVGDGSSFIQAKVWREDEDEPDDWTVERSVSSDFANTYVVAWSNASDHVGDLGVEVDYIDFGTGSSNCPIFDIRDAHYFFGTYTFASDGGGSSNGFGGTTIFADVNRPNIDIEDEDQFNYAIGVIMHPDDYAIGMGFGTMPAIGATGGIAWSVQLFSGYEPLKVIGRSGTFTFHGSDRTVECTATLAAGAHVPKTVNASFWFDPVGWVVPTPFEGQPVRDVPFPDPDDQTRRTFFTSFPYQPGSLLVYIDGVLVGFTESNPSTGQFVLDDPLPLGGIITATYLYGTSTYTGNDESADGDCMEFTGDGTTTLYDVAGGYVVGNLYVFVDELHQRPGIDYIETSPINGQITFTSPPANGADIRICYWRTSDGGVDRGGRFLPLVL